MTGYGFYSTDKKNYSIEIETKALNSKFFDFNLKSNHEISGIENEIRNFVKTKMFRGKIEVNITVNYPENKSKILDKKKYLSFFNEIKSIAKDNKVEDTTVHIKSEVSINLFQGYAGTVKRKRAGDHDDAAKRLRLTL